MQQRTPLLHYKLKKNINTKIYTTNFGQMNKIHIMWQRVMYEVSVCLNLYASHSV